MSSMAGFTRLNACFAKCQSYQFACGARVPLWRTWTVIHPDHADAVNWVTWVQVLHTYISIMRSPLHLSFLFSGLLNLFNTIPRDVTPISLSHTFRNTNFISIFNVLFKWKLQFCYFNFNLLNVTFTQTFTSSCFSTKLWLWKFEVCNNYYCYFIYFN